MTTIVCNRFGMAADKRATGMAMFKVTKLFRVGGSLIGVSGNLEQALRFIEWRKSTDTKPTFAESTAFAALEVTPEGKIQWWGAEMIPVLVENDYYAIGSGSDFALGALAMGADLKEAVKIAAQWDESTGPQVQAMTL